MKAIHITKSGGPEVLQLQETPKPIPTENQALIKVKAAGVNRSDIITRQNTATYGKGSPTTLIPGLEVSGEITEIGSAVKDKKRKRLMSLKIYYLLVTMYAKAPPMALAHTNVLIYIIFLR